MLKNIPVRLFKPVQREIPAGTVVEYAVLHNKIAVGFEKEDIRSFFRRKSEYSIVCAVLLRIHGIGAGSVFESFYEHLPYLCGSVFSPRFDPVPGGFYNRIVILRS